MTRLIASLRPWFVFAAILSLFGAARAADFTVTYDFSSVTASSGLTDPTPVPTVANLTLGSFTATGTPANPNAGGRFSFTAWPTGGVNANDNYAAQPGVLNPGQYYSVTLTPQPGYALNLTGLTFTIQRSATGIRTYAVRSNAGGDAFATNLPASISPANANLAVPANNVFFYAFDALATAQNGSTVTLTGASFQNVTGPVTFRFYGWNAEASGGTFSIDNVVFTGNVVSASGPTPPSITTPPSSQTVTEGATVQFSVGASGTAPFTYQWRKGGAPLADGGIVTGALTDTLTLTGVAQSDAGSYDVVVTNAVNSATSAAASLTVNPTLVAPSITTQPTAQAAAVGGSAVFTVGASGTAPLAYQWRKGGVPLADGGSISGSTSAALTISPVGAGDVGSYDVVVSNAAPTTATSNAVALSLTAFVTPSGQVSYAGGSYVQNFDTLPAGGTFTLTSAGPFALSAPPVNASGLGGWTFAKYDGTGAVALFRVEAGTGTSGAVYSYGTGASTDRALGSLASGSTISRFGTTLINSTGLPITEFTLSYTGEEWRGGTGTNSLAFEYALGATDINTGTFTAAPALSFTAPTAATGALVGNNAPNRTAISATITGLNWAPGQTLTLRWTDVNDGGNDDGLAIDDLSLSTPVAADAILPSVVYTTPATGTANIPVGSPLSLTFNEEVNFSAASFTLTGETSGAHTATVSGGPSGYTLTPTTPFAEGETVTLTVLAAQVTDAATGSVHPGGDFSMSFETFSSSPLPIHKIQGSGTASAYTGYAVTLQGVVVGSFQGAGQIGGYYIEEPDALQDADPATSEGIYVFDNANSVAVGDLVTVTGTISEYGSAPVSQTEISGLTAFIKVSSGNPLPTPVTVTLPFSAAGYAERYEGMLVTFPQSLTVCDNYDLGHFGEISLANGRLPTPTNVVAPGAAAQAQEAANLLNQIVLDDGLSTTSPSPTPFLNSTDPALATRRAGSTAAGVTGILDNKFGLYVVEPTIPPAFVEANPRLNSPASIGSLRVAIGNVENFMNGDGAGGGFPTSRGATTYAEFQRQLPKVTAAILNLAPDIMGLTEIENDRITNGAPDSYGPTSAIAQLVASLNAHAPAGTTYAFVNASAVDTTTDDIHVALIYRTQTVAEAGTPAMQSDPAFNNVARNPLAQTFRELASGSKLTVCINHFRAKASAAAGAGNADSGDGQGTNNALRVQEADAVTSWLATFPTGDNDPDILIIGDLNAYAKEDPITHIKNAGFTNLSELYEGEGGYSYAFNGEFGHLDHALATPSLVSQVFSTATWHVNSDEPVYYDYNLEDKDATQQAINAGTPYRYSDHDPVVIGVQLNAAPVVTTAPVAQTVTAGSSVTFSVAATGSPAPTFQWRRNGVAIGGATSSSYTIAHPTTVDAGSYDVVVTNGIGSVISSAATLTVNPGSAGLALSGLSAAYDGLPHPATVVTSPAGLPVTVTYNGTATAPVAPGWYTVVATINSPDYTGTATDVLFIDVTALVRHLPTLDGAVRGSVQVVTAENSTLNGNGSITGDLLVPGSPTLRLNGQPTYSGTLDGTGAVAPTTATITLNGGAKLRHVVRRTNAQTLVAVAAPPSPTGTRSVSINAAGQSPGDFATIRNLTLNSNAGQLVLPAGTYGALTANGTSSFVLGVAGATTPAVYNLQSLTINGTSRLVIVGPVTINLASGVALNGTVGTTDHPEWLQFNIASGGLTLNGTITFAGDVNAPSGTITINGASVLTGRIIADRLTVNGSGVLADPE
ncbi:MAG: ExeM/NucH family extracellular endonuclease [Lacunisphaera sp.]